MEKKFFQILLLATALAVPPAAQAIKSDTASDSKKAAAMAEDKTPNPWTADGWNKSTPEERKKAYFPLVQHLLAHLTQRPSTDTKKVGVVWGNMTRTEVGNVEVEVHVVTPNHVHPSVSVEEAGWKNLAKPYEDETKGGFLPMMEVKIPLRVNNSDPAGAEPTDQLTLTFFGE